MSLFWIVLIVLAVLLVSAVPAYPYSRGWGWTPSGIITLVLVVFLILWLTGVIAVRTPAV